MLHVHRSERADPLVSALAEILADPPSDPLDTEVVAVHSRGIERWIAQELSTRLGVGALGADGVCANVDFPFPGRLIRAAVATASGSEPATDPWLPERSTWPLLAIVDEDPHHARLGPLAAHVGPGGGTGDARRLGAVRHIADLYDRYGVHRPEMILAWRDGRDLGADGRPLDPHHVWQAELWRELRRRINRPSFPERQRDALARIRGERDLLPLPDRLVLFGLTALPATYLQVLAAIAAHRAVHLMLLHPSPSLWDRIAETDAVGAGLAPRDRDPTAEFPSNPLLRSWGRDARELQLTAPLDDARSHHHPVEHGSAETLLARIQDDVRSDRLPGGRGVDRPPLVLAPDDRSVQIHDCHGRLRQVEVLRDAILHLLADDPSLELRDIIVMCPDIEGFASLVTAVFGADTVSVAGDDDGVPPALRVRLADRSLRRTNPVLDVVSSLLDLADGRVTASSVIELMSRPPVRRRFLLDDDDLETLEGWVAELQIRWGFDADHRQREGLPPLDANTWEAGLRRLQLGITMADEDHRLFEGTAPFDGVEGHRTALAGRLAELVTRLRVAVGSLRGPYDLEGWRAAIGDATDALTRTDGPDAWQRAHLDRVLEDLVDEATVPGVDLTEITLPELETLLDERLAGRPSTTSHRTGDLTFCTLVPMRSVPHRVVCLLGLDDGAFPRQTVPDSDDLLLDAPQVGDRDLRSEDRQLLLDALLAATDTLVVTYAGRDVRTGEPRPPAVPVDELLDVVDRTAVTVDGRPARAQVVVRHPLAEHDPRNFAERALDPSRRSWGFHPSTLAAAQAQRSPSRPRPPFLSKPLPLPDEDVIDLDDLVDFLQHPVRAFCRQQLDVRFPSSQDRLSDSIPSALEALDGWKVGQALLDAWRAGDDLERTEELLDARGMLPPGDLRDEDLTTIRDRVARIIELCEHRGIDPTQRYGHADVHVELRDGRLLSGVVTGLAGWRLETISYSQLKPKARLASWARFLAVSATHPAGQWTAVTAARHEKPWWKHKATTAELPTLAGSEADVRGRAVGQLERLVELYDRGRREPLPLYCETSQRIAENLHSDDPADRYVYIPWQTTYAPIASEDLDPYHVAALGGQAPPDELFRELCRNDESGWADDERRVVAYAWRLWEPILRHERRSVR